MNELKAIEARERNLLAQLVEAQSQMGTLKNTINNLTAEMDACRSEKKKLDQFAAKSTKTVLEEIKGNK